MASYKVGDTLADCPTCGAKDSIIYRGGKEAVCNKCGLICEIELEEGEQIEPDAPVEEPPQQPEEQPVSQPEPEPAPPAQPDPEPETPAPHVPKPVMPEIPAQGGITQADSAFDTPPVNTPPQADLPQADHAPAKVVVDGESGLKLNEVVGGADIPVREPLKLAEPETKVKADALKIPNHIRKSRPWRWAQEMGNTGNPYRHGSKSYEVFLMISHGETNIPRLVTHLYEQKPEVCDKMNILLTVYEVVTQCIAAGLLLMHPETGMLMVCQGPPQMHSLP